MLVKDEALRRWTAGLLLVTVAIPTMSVVLHFTARDTAWHDLYSYFALSGEYNLAACWNAALLGLVSAAAFLSGAWSGRGRSRWGWFVVASITLFMSVDEATQIHERTGDLVTTNPLPTFPWVVVAVPLAIVLVGVLTLATRTLEPPVRRRLGLALAAYLLGALVFEALSGYYWRQLRPNVSEAFGTIEEVLEMVACIYALHVVVSSWLPMHILVRAAQDEPGTAEGEHGAPCAAAHSSTSAPRNG